MQAARYANGEQHKRCDFPFERINQPNNKWNPFNEDRELKIHPVQI